MIPAATTGWAIYPGLAGTTIGLKDIGGHGTDRPGYRPGTRGAGLVSGRADPQDGSDGEQLTCRSRSCSSVVVSPQPNAGIFVTGMACTRAARSGVSRAWPALPDW